MKVRLGKKVMVYDFTEEEWIKTEIVHISDGVVSLKDDTGSQYDAELTELDDIDCYKEM